MATQGPAAPPPAGGGNLAVVAPGPVRLSASPPGKARGLAGLRVVSFESRRAQDLGLLIRQSGGEICYAPATREVPLADEQAILDFGARLFQGKCDSLVLFTGVGTTILIDALCTRWPRAAVLGQLQHTALLCRGPKPASALRAVGLTPRLVAPEPHGERELLACIEHGLELAGRSVFVQDCGLLDAAGAPRSPSLRDFLDGLRARGASVTPVRVYSWALPADPRELRQGLTEIVNANVDVAVFTSTHQVDNAFEYAARVGLLEPLREALSGSVLVASLGVVTSEALGRHGVHADLSPEQPKLGALVDCLARAASTLQFEKQRQHMERRGL
ncbi:MAG TPA: uroporphyrinogen-III synthase [Polyangiaceae bacterium]|nr:uroporphyrinogen-III synthase [Polyangiaceae bacterium]